MSAPWRYETKAFRTVAADHVPIPCGAPTPLWFSFSAISSSDIPFEHPSNGGDLVIHSEALVADDDPEPDRTPTTDVGNRDVLVIVERLGKPADLFLEKCHYALLLVDGFRRLEARGISEGVKGTGGVGGEDKERSGTRAALTPKRRALKESGRRLGGARH